MAAGLVIGRGSGLGFSDYIREFDSNATLAASDLVNLESGQLEVASTGDWIGGQVLEAATSSSTGVQVNVTRGLRVVMDNDNVGTTFAATHEGQRFDITGATGAQLVDTSTADATYTGPGGQLVCLEYNPQFVRGDLDTDTSVGLFMIYDSQF